jgi:Tetratricopeptide repeat
VSSNRDMRWMRGLGRLGLVGAGVGLMAAAHMARAQGSCTFTDENGKTVTWPNCQPPADDKSSDTKSPPPNGTTPPNAPATAPGSSPAKGFPFPGETPTAPPVTPGTPAGQSAGGAPPAGATGAPVANGFPFPGEDSTKSAAKPGDSSSGPMKDAGSSGSSSSSSSGGDDSSAGPLGDDGADTDPAAKAAEARRAERLKKERGTSVHQTPDQRETEDLKVASFYQSDGNFKGAYERASDAVSIAADDADAHLALAEAARRLGKLDEAATHYKKCLTLDPVPKTKRTAERALKEMTSGG